MVNDSQRLLNYSALAWGGGLELALLLLLQITSSQYLHVTQNVPKVTRLVPNVFPCFGNETVMP